MTSSAKVRDAQGFNEPTKKLSFWAVRSRVQSKRTHSTATYEASSLCRISCNIVQDGQDGHDPVAYCQSKEVPFFPLPLSLQ